MANPTAELKVKIDADTKQLKTGLDKANTQVGGFSKNIKKHSKAIGIAMIAMGVAIVGGLLVVAKAAAQFEKAMREVNTMIGLTAVKFQELSDQVKQVSSDVGIAAIELSGALYQIVSAGIAGSDAINVLGVASKAAVAGVTDVATAADGLTTVLNAFKISSEDALKVADIMFTVVKRGKTTFEQLSSALFNVAPLAAAAGIKFEEVAAAIATITKQGVPTTVATTQLRAAIQAIIKPTADMTSALDAMGIESGEALIAEQGLTGAISLLREQAGGSLSELGAMFGSVEALSGVLSLTGENAATFAEDIKATTEDAAGAVETAYKEMNESVTRRFNLMWNDIKLAGMEMGEALLPILTSIMEHITPIIQNLKDWIAENEGLIKGLLWLGGILAAGGALILGLVLVTKAITAISTALAIMHGLSGPAGWAILAAGIAIAAGAIIGIKTLMGDTTEMPSIPAVDPDVEWAREWLKKRGVEGYQYGGIVPGPIGEPVPVIAHGGEEFAGVGKTFGGDVHVHIGNFMGDESSLRLFTRKLKEIMGQETRRTSFPSINRLEYFPGSSAP